MKEINFPEDFDMENLENQVLLNFTIEKKSRLVKDLEITQFLAHLSRRF